MSAGKPEKSPGPRPIAATSGCGLLVLSAPSPASDFTPLMLMMLVPFGFAALFVIASTWLTTIDLRPFWLQALIRVAGLCLVFTPTHTAGGNGQMRSVAMYDIIVSGFGGDLVYAKQALVNAAIATAVLVPLVVLVRHLRGKRPETS